MSEAEIAGDFAAALLKVRQGLEVIVEHQSLPVAVLRAVDMPRRTAAEILALMAEDSTAVMDADFAQDVERVIKSREPLNTSKWD